MTLNSNYEIGDVVYFYDKDKSKVLTGKINGLLLSVDENGDEDWSYRIGAKKPSGEFEWLSKVVDGNFVFKTRDDVFKFAYQMTENI